MKDVGEREQPERAGHDPLPRQPGGKGGQHGSVERVGQGVGRDHLACRVQPDAQVARDGGQDARDHEGVGADGEGAQRQQPDARVEGARVW